MRECPGRARRCRSRAALPSILDPDLFTPSEIRPPPIPPEPQASPRRPSLIACRAPAGCRGQYAVRLRWRFPAVRRTAPVRRRLTRAAAVALGTASGRRGPSALLQTVRRTEPTPPVPSASSEGRHAAPDSLRRAGRRDYRRPPCRRAALRRGYFRMSAPRTGPPVRGSGQGCRPAPGSGSPVGGGAPFSG